MISSYIEKNIRKTIPIHEKIHPIKLMNFSKIISKVCKSKCTCQILTKTSENTWIFKYQSNYSLYITLSFCNKSTDPYAYICIDDFIFPKNYRDQGWDDKILKAIINYIQYLDFEILVYPISQPSNLELFIKNGFKQVDVHKMILSLKPKFIKI